MISAEAREWMAKNIGQPIIDWDENGARIAVDAPPLMAVRREWCDNHFGLGAMWQPDGSLWLDEAGEHRYQHVLDLPDGASAYKKIST